VSRPQALSGNKLIADIMFRFAKDGYDIAFDLTIDNPVCNEQTTAMSVKDEQKYLRDKAEEKNKKYHEECQNNGCAFTPIVLSAFGGILDESYSSGIKFFLHKIKRNNFVPPNWAATDVKTYWLQRIAITLWSGNVRQVGHFLAKGSQLRC